MFDAIMTIGGALFLTKFWSIWGEGYFYFLCAAAAIACAFAAPLLMEKPGPVLGGSCEIWSRVSDKPHRLPVL